jgi:hypothetical protein
MNNEQGMPALPSGCLETDRPIWKHITAREYASIGEEAGCLADKIDAAITDLAHTYAREYAAQQTAELRAEVELQHREIVSWRKLFVELETHRKAELTALQSRLDEAVALVAALHKIVKENRKRITVHKAERDAEAFLAKQEAT